MARFSTSATLSRRTALVPLCLMLVGSMALTGCGRTSYKTEPEFKISGKILRGGNPLPLDPVMAAAKAASVNIKFIRTDGSDGANFSESAFADETGAFSVKLPKGKYRISIVHTNGRQPGDNLQGKFSDRKSKIEKEISGEMPDLVIELDEYK
jgi:hypothetical protein